MFKLHFWDAGENALKKFDHVLPVSNISCMIIRVVFVWLKGITKSIYLWCGLVKIFDQHDSSVFSWGTLETGCNTD